MAEINIFNYVSGNTVFHKMHPVLKIILLCFTSFFLVSGKLAFLYSLVLTLICLKVAKFPIKNLLYSFRYSSILGLIIFILLLFTQGVTFTDKMLISLIYSGRIGALLFLGQLFTYTTRPQDISEGFYLLTKSSRISGFIYLTLSLFHTFALGINRIQSSLKSRGLYNSRNPFLIIKYLITPIFIETFKKSYDISLAMESRCYSGYKSMELKAREVNLILIIPVLLGFLPDFLLQIKMP